MERLTENVLGFTQLKACGNDFCKEICAEHDEEKDCNNCPIQKAFEKLAEYEDLEEQGKMLKDPQELKDNILGRMKEFMDEYRSYSKSSIDHFGGKADAMETAMRIVKAMFSEKNI